MPRYIDADAFWKAMTTRFDSCADLDEISDVLDSMPTISPDEVRGKGKWIHKPHIHGVVYCSECDYELRVDDTNYCPSCGARMNRAEAEKEMEGVSEDA